MRFGLHIEPYAAAMIVSALVALLLGARAWFGTRKAVSRSFALLQTAIFVWSAFRLVQWEIVSPEGQLDAVKLQFAGMFFIPPGFYMFARALANRPARGIRAFLILLPGLAFLALVATNEISHFFWAPGELASLPLYPTGAWGFWAFIGYAYAHVLVAIAIIWRVARRSRGMTGRWMRQLLALLILPCGTNAMYVLFFIGRSAYDPTPIVFAFSALFIAVALNSYDFLEVVPYAKSVVLESIDSPLIVADAEGLIVGANEEARRVSADAGRLEGRPVTDLVPALSGAESDRETREWSFGGIDYLITCYLVKRRGHWGGRIYLFRDISALVAARRETEEARARADAASAAKSAFVATVSHELRNPLNAIIGLADLDLRAGPPPELRADLEVILSSGNILLGLVNDLLDLSKIEAGRMELESVDFDLHEQAASILKSFRPAVERKSLSLDIVVEEGTPRLVRGDPLRYGQVLMNLVSNAVKFTERGAVTVTLSAVTVTRSPDPRALGVLTTVRDTGMGIEGGQLPRLFQEFSQADASIGRRFGGTGLGLSISKRLVELFGGEISVASAPGEGSSFSFTARFERGEAAADRPGPEAAGPGRGLRVLVVDDDPINVAVATRYLARLGHEALSAGSGAEAVAMAGETALDLVLLDLGLPDMDGFEACRRIRSETTAGQVGSLAMAAMTARDEAGLRGACAAAGMIGYIAKPIDPAAFEALLSRAAAAPRGLGPHAAASVRLSAERDEGRAAYPEPAGSGDSLIDEAALLERLDGDRSFALELLGIFAREAPGRRADFAAAVAARDLEALQGAAHSLKGSALSLCANAVGAEAGRIEADCIALRRGGDSEAAFGRLAEGVDRLDALLEETRRAAAILEREG